MPCRLIHEKKALLHTRKEISMSTFRLAWVWAASLFLPASAFSQQGSPLTPESFYTQLPQGTTTDLSRDLSAILPPENGGDFCDNYWGALDRRTQKVRNLPDARLRELQRDMINCGKWLFFYLPIKTEVAFPDILLTALSKTFPDETGHAMERVGFRENPREPGQPLELPLVKPDRSKPRGWITPKVRTLACTGCHLNQLPDGRYSVGAPNDGLDLGLFNKLSAYPLWLAARGERDPIPWDPDLDAAFRDMYERSKGRVNFARALLDAVVLLDILNVERLFYGFVGQDPLPETDQRTFLKSGRGRINPATPMLSDPENEIYVSSPPIWKMRHYEGGETDEPYLGRVVSSRNLEEFIRQAFVFSTLKTNYSIPKYVDPLAAYLRVLEVPEPEFAVEENRFQAGEVLFAEDCVSCHNGYEGSTQEIYALDEVNSPLFFDRLFVNYVPPTRQSERALRSLQEVGMLPLERTGIKSRRLTGIWARQRLATNGAIEGLDHLLCLEGRTRTEPDRENGLSDATHTDLCTEYSETERLALKEFLTHNTNW